MLGYCWLMNPNAATAKAMSTANDERRLKAADKV